MSDEPITVARPYAKAAFDFAVEHQSIDHWQKMIMFATEVIRNKQISELLSSSLTPKTLSDSFIAVCGNELDEAGKNFIRIMASNGRLSVLPEVLQLYIQQRNAMEGISEVNLISANIINNKQLIKISVAIEKRLSRTVKLNCKIDKSLIAGVIIQMGDIVIDNSVRGRLDRFANALKF